MAGTPSNDDKPSSIGVLLLGGLVALVAAYWLISQVVSAVVFVAKVGLSVALVAAIVVFVLKGTGRE